MIGKTLSQRIIMVMSTVLLLSTLTCAAQRRNQMGYKMVSKVAFRCFNSEGVEWKHFARDISYLYDDKDKLIGIDDTEHLEDGDWTIKYRKEEGRIIGRKYHNGRLFPSDSVVIKGRVRFEHCTAFDDAGKKPLWTDCTMTSTVTNGNALAIIKEVYTDYHEVKPGNTVDIKEYIDRDIEYMAEDHFCSSNLIGNHYCPFNGAIIFYFSKEGNMYWHKPFDPSADMDLIYFVDGDMQYRVADRRSDGVDYEYRGDIMTCNEYTDLINDTNVEFLGFAWTPYGKWFSLPEYSSDWYPMRSKHLIKYERRDYPTSRQRMADIKERYPEYYEQKWGSKDVKCNSEWDYEFDSSGNLVRIDFIHHDWFDNHCVIHIKYVDE